MAFIVCTLLAVSFLEGTAQIALIALGALIEIAEIAIWLRWRKAASTTGVESMVGMTGVAISDCRPDGQVKVKGQIWKAHCGDGVGAGEAVSVVAVDGLRLDVAPR